MSLYNLKNNGDDTEKKYFDLFIKKEFPRYEEFWVKFIVPLTNRPIDIYFKSDSELDMSGKSANDVCMAQLHYTVLKHLVRVYDLMQINPLMPDQFLEAIVRLCAGLDVADELLERFTSEQKYDPWLESEGQRARKNWRGKNNRMQYLRNYRNRLLHGRILPSILIVGTYLRYRIPRFREENKYLDWRMVTNESAGAEGDVRKDFDSPNNLLNQAWRDILSYLEKNWKEYLL